MIKRLNVVEYLEYLSSNMKKTIVILLQDNVAQYVENNALAVVVVAAYDVEFDVVASHVLAVAAVADANS